MTIKLLVFGLIQVLPLVVWTYLLRKRSQKVDFRLMLSYFIIGSWFGILGELFLYQLVDSLVHQPIWEYRILPIHGGITSLYGPYMWGMACVYIGFHKHYYLWDLKVNNALGQFFLEAVYLMVLEVIFNFVGYGLFQEYYFYYFVPDLGHWTSFTNIPFWWMGYHVASRLALLFNRKEKLSACIAGVIIVVLVSYQ